MKHTHILPLLLLLLLQFLSCTEDPITPAASSLVVEGYIEDGGRPVVMVTKSMPITTKKQNLNDLEKYLVRWAKVSVINGRDTVVLTGRYDKGYFPPYIYSTARMRGQAGGTYKLLVEYDGTVACATTTITAPPLVEGFKVEKCLDSDTLYQIKAVMAAEEGKASNYQFFSRVGSTTKQFTASFLGGYNDSITSGIYEVPVYRGRTFTAEDYTPYFSVNDTVAVKCCRLDDVELDFWKAYMASAFLANGAMLSVSNNLPSNIVGGTGYWFGYGSTTSYFIIKDSVR